MRLTAGVMWTPTNHLYIKLICGVITFLNYCLMDELTLVTTPRPHAGLEVLGVWAGNAEV